MLDQQGRFVISDYMRREPFSSFLPGIAGERGIPMWCYYVSRGQCVTSFGVEDKDHAIMEFFPAHQAYQYTQRVGFRTFVRSGGVMAEPFAQADASQRMIIGMNELTISERCSALPVAMSVTYTTLPHERAAALVRRVTLTNEGPAPLELEVLDGMPALIPYGVDLDAVKQMAQTAKAWMQAERTQEGVALFRVRASMQDTSDVHEVSGVNFAMACTQTGERLRAFVDPRHVFSWDTALDRPRGFEAEDYDAFVQGREVTQNNLPCCFFARRIRLAPGQSAVHTVLVGQSESREKAMRVCERMAEPGALEQKIAGARELAHALTDPIATRTANPVFDMYCRQTYLDNLLRGGAPTVIAGGHVVHLYSRKHGDPERDYNAFRMRPEYDSQGNGNFRDVNQNRRCDVLFEPRTAEANILTFYGLIQADGYNPLVIEAEQFTAEGGELCRFVAPQDRAEAERLLAGTFTAGMLRMAAEQWRFEPGMDEEKFFVCIMERARMQTRASFGEGYWSDHWTYNLDQVDSYLSVYPEDEEALLYDREALVWHVSPVRVLPRAQRYAVTDRGIRQYRFLEPHEGAESELNAPDGSAVRATLMEKLLVIAAVKTSTLDPMGMGVEMEGGKPGWYDALNGLPGLLGSSMPETLELCRMLEKMAGWLERYDRGVRVLAEAAELMRRVTDILAKTREGRQDEGAHTAQWNALSDAREVYRARIYGGVSGRKEAFGAGQLREMIGLWLAFVRGGVKRAMALGGGLCPTYFAYDVTAYTRDGQGIHPTAFALRRLPDFLEAQVRYLRLELPQEERVRLLEAVRASRLYDGKLNMYKVNAALGEAGYEIGRAHAFTPGWLENESVWLHMEYKYLLEMLRARLYGPFTEDFLRAAVPFLDSDVYGRSTLENSSFIASSANPDEAIHGKGFVARLSGSTAEFLSMWQIMLLGERLFAVRDGELELRLRPLLPKALTRGQETVEATLLGRTRVIYHIAPGEDYVPGNYRVSRRRTEWTDGTVWEGALRGEAARRVRAGEAVRLELWLENRAEGEN